jgi:hypothetical protein
MARRMSVLPVVSETTRSDSATDNPEAIRVERVEANRATTRCLMSGPKTGRESKNRSRR